MPRDRFGNSYVDGNANFPVQVSGSNITFAEAVPGSGAGDDSNDLTSVADSTYASADFLYVGTSGDVVITTGGSDLTLVGLAGGVWHPLPPFTRVKATNTTASDLVAGYGV